MVALSPVAHGLARPDPRRVTLLLALGTLLLALLSLGTGAAGLGPTELLSALTGEGLDRRAQVILWDIRLPRLALVQSVSRCCSAVASVATVHDCNGHLPARDPTAGRQCRQLSLRR